MFKLQVRKNPEDLKESGTGGAYISESGVYPITVNFVSLEKSERGAVSFNLNIDYKGSQQTIYGPTIMNTDGSENEIGYRVLNKLFIIAGLDNGQILNVETETKNVGKDNKPMQLDIIQELYNIECQIYVKEEFSFYKGEIKRKLIPESFFATDGASADEITSIDNGNTSIVRGTQLKKLLEKGATTKYRSRANKGTGEPAPTDEQIEAYKKNPKQFTNSQQPTVQTPIKKNLFAVKR